MRVNIHMKIKYFNLSTEKLEIRGKSIDNISYQVGSTPFYLYDRSIIAHKVDLLKSKLSKNISLHYAIKANPMPALVCFLSRIVDGFDVASSGELKVALDSGMSSSKISFAGPGKTQEELSQAIAAEVLINVESPNEMYRIFELSKKINVRPRIGLRINPHFEMKSSGMKMGGGAKPFGIDSESIPELINKMDSLGLSIEGLHLYPGSQSLNAEIIAQTQNQSIDFILGLKKYFKSPLKIINIGGGFGIPYFENEEELNLDLVIPNLNHLSEKIKNNFPEAEIVLELGRYLVGESGIYISRIIDKKISRGKTFLILDGGMNHHLAASGNLGQVIKKNFPIHIASRLQSKDKERVSVVGPLCTPLDQFATDIEIETCEVGDLVAVFQSGAYGLTSSPQDFLSHARIKEVLL